MTMGWARVQAEGWPYLLVFGCALAMAIHYDVCTEALAFVRKALAR
jgi:hypothetical protein